MGFTLSLGDKSQDFLLPSTEGKIYSLKNFEDAKVLVIFFYM